MKKNILGTTDLAVSEICLGTMTFGDQNTEIEGFAQMDAALEAGVNFFDTAELYPIPPQASTQGRTEEIIGNWFEARKNRDQIILATKVVGRTAWDWFRDHGKAASLTRAEIFEAAEKSLKRLKTDYIDLYQVHWPDRPVTHFGSNPVIFKHHQGPEVPIEETLDALSDLVKQGKVRHIGLSNESGWGAMRYLELSRDGARARPQSIQNAYSYLNRTFEVALAEIAMREKLGLLAYSPLAQGYLTGKYRGGVIPAGSRRALFDRLQRYETPNANAAIDAYCDLATERGLDAAQMALAFCLSRPFMTSVIIGASTMEQLKTNLGSVNVNLDEDTLSAINAIHIRYCNPCP